MDRATHFFDPRCRDEDESLRVYYVSAREAASETRGFPDAVLAGHSLCLPGLLRAAIHVRGRVAGISRRVLVGSSREHGTSAN